MGRFAYMTAASLLLAACPGPDVPLSDTRPDTQLPDTGPDGLLSDSSPGADVSVSTKYLSVHVINVGQAEGIAVVCPDNEVGMIIDSGDSQLSSQDRFKAYITKLMNDDKDKQIPLVVASHPHADHIGNLKWVVQTYMVYVYVDNGQVYNTTVYTDLMKAVRQSERIKGTKYQAVDKMPLTSKVQRSSWQICDGAVVTVLMPAKGFLACSSNPNNCSVILRLDYGRTSYLFVGDAEVKEENVLLADPEVKAKLDVSVLKVGHHGSDTSSSSNFLDAVKPLCTLVSCGKKDEGMNKGYKFPRASVLENLNKILHQVVPNMPWRTETVQSYDGVKGVWVDMQIRAGISLTPLDGDIVSKTDGETVTCR